MGGAGQAPRGTAALWEPARYQQQSAPLGKIGGGGGGGQRGALAGAVLVGGGLLVRQLRALLGAGDGGVGCIQRLRHLLTDDVHQPLKGLLDVDVVLGAGLEELEAWRWGGVRIWRGGGGSMQGPPVRVGTPCQHTELNAQ